MRTRKADTPKSTPPAKKTPPVRKTAVKSQTPPSSGEPATESPVTATATPSTIETKRATPTRSAAKQMKPSETLSTPTPAAEPAVEEAKATGAAVEVIPGTKPTTVKRVTRKVVRKVVRKKTPASAKAAADQTLNKAAQTAEAKGEGSVKENNEEVVRDGADVVKYVEPPKKDVADSVDNEQSSNTDEKSSANSENLLANEEFKVEKVEISVKKDRNDVHLEEPEYEEDPEEDEEPFVENVEKSAVELVTTDLQSSEDKEPSNVIEDLNKEKEESGSIEDKVEADIDAARMEEDVKEPNKEDPDPDESGDERIEGISDQEVHDEEEFAEDDFPEHGEEAEALDVERGEINAAAEERKRRKELEVFVGGLDRDTTEEEVRKAFEHVGEVSEVRLHKDSSNSKNKGYAYVRFATKEQAARALSEMKNPVIHGKRCGTAANEDNDTLFLGNICNTWTKEAIRQKLKDYGVETVQSITLVADPRHEGLSRGFAFLEFPCHADAMLAYKRLQKPDVIFGHSEYTAKVGFAEPLREPDPEVMAQVKSVFIDGLPPHWDEDRVRERFKGFGEIARTQLARNMSTAKRKDFGFVDFTTHEAALACVDSINNTELGDGNSKNKVRARLSNPLPKTQAVKGEICGGFRIGRTGSGAYPRHGRGFGRGGHTFGRGNFQHGRGFYPRGPVQGGRMGFPSEIDRPYPPFQGRQNFGRGGRWGFRDGPQASGSGPSRPNLDRPRYPAVYRGRADPDSFRRPPFPLQEGFDRPFVGRHFDDRYFYDHPSHGMKRPFSLTDQDNEYMEPSRLRPRLDYSDPAASVRGNHYRDAFGADAGRYPQNYQGSDYGGGAYSSFYRNDRPYGRGYYY